MIRSISGVAFSAVVFISACGSNDAPGVGGGSGGTAVSGSGGTAGNGVTPGSGGSSSVDAGSGSGGSMPAGDDAGASNTDVMPGGTGGAPPATNGAKPSLSFHKVTLQTMNLAEGINAGDFNKDGVLDVVSGPFWWEGPGLTKMHTYFPPPPNNGYTNMTLHDWADYTVDVDGDGWVDVITCDRPAQMSYWYRNPGMPMVAADVTMWEKKYLGTLNDEHYVFADISGDGKPDLVAANGGSFGWFTVANASPWVFTPVTPGGYVGGPYVHGLGIGDIDGDGKAELIEQNGWWSRGADGAPWTKHAMAFGPGAQIYTYDVNNDGMNDVVMSTHAHGYGVGWYEQTKAGGAIGFTYHSIVGDAGAMNVGGIPSYSQPHAFWIADMDLDGITDIVSGKSFYAHPPGKGDPDPDGTPFIYVFKLIRNADKTVTWEPHLVDKVVGLGRQFTTADVNGDGLQDVLVGSKHGTFVFLQDPAPAGQ